LAEIQENPGAIVFWISWRIPRSEGWKARGDWEGRRERIREEEREGRGSGRMDEGWKARRNWGGGEEGKGTASSGTGSLPERGEEGEGRGRREGKEGERKPSETGFLGNPDDLLGNLFTYTVLQVHQSDGTICLLEGKVGGGLEGEAGPETKSEEV
jgi:hypothetical protein